MFCFWLKIYILIHIRLCGRVSDKIFSLGRFPETRLLFLPSFNFFSQSLANDDVKVNKTQRFSAKIDDLETKLIAPF